MKRKFNSLPERNTWINTWLKEQNIKIEMYNFSNEKESNTQSIDKAFDMIFPTGDHNHAGKNPDYMMQIPELELTYTSKTITISAGDEIVKKIESFNHQLKIMAILDPLLAKGADYSRDDKGNITIVKLDNKEEITKMAELPDGITFKTEGSLTFENLIRVPESSTWSNDGDLYFPKAEEIGYNTVYDNNGEISFDIAKKVFMATFKNTSDVIMENVQKVSHSKFFHSGELLLDSTKILEDSVVENKGSVSLGSLVETKGNIKIGNEGELRIVNILNFGDAKVELNTVGKILLWGLESLSDGLTFGGKGIVELDEIKNNDLVKLKEIENNLPVNKETGYHDIGFDVNEKSIDEAIAAREYVLGEKLCDSRVQSIPSTINPPPSKDMYLLNIEDVPYNVTFSKSSLDKTRIKIEDCAGSALWKMNNDPDITGNRFSDEKTSSSLLTDDGAVFLDFDFDGSDIIVKISPEYIPREEKMDMLAEWVSENLDRIKTIGYETLSSEESVLEKISNLGVNTIEEKENENQNEIKGIS